MITHNITSNQYQSLWDKFVPEHREKPGNLIIKDMVGKHYNGLFDTYNNTIIFQNQKDLNWFLLNT